MTENLKTFQFLLRQAEEGAEQAFRALCRAQELATDQRQAEKLENARARARILQDAVDELVRSR